MVGVLTIVVYSLQYAAGKMARYFVSSKKQLYCHARTFVKNNLYRQIMAEFINHLSDINKYQDQLPTHASANNTQTITEKLSTQQLIKLILATSASIKDCDACETDHEQCANLLFIRDAEICLLLSQSIKYSDIGFFCWAIDYLILMFHGIRKPHYAKLFLYLKHLIDSNHAIPKARRCIAAALLVNPSGTPNGFYPIDFANEFHNWDIKQVWADWQSFSATLVQKLTIFCTLNTIFIKPVHHILHHLWGQNTSSKHTKAARAKLLENIARCFWVTMKKNNLWTRKISWSQNIFAIGCKKLITTALADYNARFLFATESADAETTVQVIWEEDLQAEEIQGEDSLGVNIEANDSIVEAQNNLWAMQNGWQDKMMSRL